MKKKKKAEGELPPLTEQGVVTINTLMKLFEGQLWAFADFLNDSPDKIVPTWKYVDYILFAFKMDLDKKHPKAKKWAEKLFPEEFPEPDRKNVAE
jgi:hypothetical protein